MTLGPELREWGMGGGGRVSGCDRVRVEGRVSVVTGESDMTE